MCVCVCVKGCRARARTRCESSAAVPLLLYCKLPSLGAREIEGQVQKSDRQLRGAFLKNRILYVHTLNKIRSADKTSAHQHGANLTL